MLGLCLLPGYVKGEAKGLRSGAERGEQGVSGRSSAPAPTRGTHSDFWHTEDGVKLFNAKHTRTLFNFFPKHGLIQNFLFYGERVLARNVK